MATSDPTVVLVDAYTSGKYLPPEFAALGARLVHVQSTPEFMPSMPVPDLSPYQVRVVHRDLDETVALLVEHSPLCVLAGQEPGVLLADALAERLGVPTNGTALSPARRDKYSMIEALRAAGLHCAEQFKSDDPEALVGWSERARDYPVVVKPLSSAAGDSVVVCDGPDQVRAAAKAVLAAETIYGEPNGEALVQSYLHGNEYVVDMVSCQGRRYVCGVWQYRKRLLPSGRNVYDREHLLTPNEAPAPELMEYVSRVLDALAVDYGPTHAEVIVTAEGPALVEIGTRIAGNMHPGFHTRCAGANQAALTALAYLRPDEFLARYAGLRYQKLSEAVCCTTSTTLNGVVDGIDQRAVDEIADLQTVYGLDVKISPGDRIRPTVDLYSSTLRVFLHASAMADIDRDYQRILRLKDRVYRIRDEAAGP